MTDLYDAKERADRLVGVDAIRGELRQFKKLQHLSNHDVAFRMAVTLREVQMLRKQFHQLDHPLYTLKIDYAIRVILGKAGIKTTGALLAQSDRQLLDLPLIGKARLAHIRRALENFL
jgi:DNA-directed RNA polymerase alpha subunit